VASIYVHIPFCERKCLYCDFYSLTDTRRVEDFVAALMQEIALRRDLGGRAAIETVFFGGGTPSLLTPGQLERILSHLHATFGIAPDAEVTLEANPGTATEEALRAFRSLGINRLSIGIQSFQEHELKALGRIHDRAEALRCVELARAAGFENLGLDLIYSIPGQTLAEWEDNLRTATDLAPQHVAAYSLIVEDGTPLARMVRAGKVRVNATELEAGMYELAMEMLEARGYEHYEVSNYALPGFRCRHNGAYWSHGDYLGFGPSAHSFRKEAGGKSGRRWWNVADLSTYLNRLRDGCLPVESGEQVGPTEMRSERIFLGLRSDGLDLRRLLLDFQQDLAAKERDTFHWMTAGDLASLSEGVLRLRPKGYLVCDEICRRLLRT
jgi:oxygen-independent coproporphyrinogen-3 oxidase